MNMKMILYLRSIRMLEWQEQFPTRYLSKQRDLTFQSGFKNKWHFCQIQIKCSSSNEFLLWMESILWNLNFNFFHFSVLSLAMSLYMLYFVMLQTSKLNRGNRKTKIVMIDFWLQSKKCKIEFIKKIPQIPVAFVRFFVVNYNAAPQNMH